MQVNMLEAKNQLSKLVQAALDGDEVVIARNGKPQVRLVKIASQVRRKPGGWAHLMTEAEVDAAFAPEVDAEIARPYPKSRLEPARKPRARRPGARRGA